MEALELLVIEDDEADADLLRAYIDESTRIDADIDHAATLKEGLDAFDGSSHDLILLDLLLPDASAEETLERVCGRASDAPVVALTGNNSPDLERTALHYGVDEFLSKDALDTELLARTLPRAIERDRFLRDLRLLKRGLDAVQEGVVFWDVRTDDRTIVYCNPAFLEMSGYDEEELLDSSVELLSCEETNEQDFERIERAFERGEPLEVELLCSRKDGEQFWNSVAFAPVERDDEMVTHFVAFHRDVTRRVEAERELQRYETLVEEATDAMFFKDAEGRYQLVNEHVEQLFDASRDEILGATDAEFFDPEVAQAVRDRDELVRQSGEPMVEEEVVEFPVGERTYLTTTVPYEVDGEPAGTIGIARDITELQQLEQQALYDHLTGLPNRHLVRDRIRQALEQKSQGEDQAFAVGLVDLDNFGDINDSLGHEIGDKVLKRAAERLESTLAASDTVGRLVGGDEFILLIENSHTREELRQLAASIEEAFDAPFTFESTNVYVSTSTGFALHSVGERLEGDVEARIDQLIRTADDAMSRAKESPAISWRLLSPGSNQSYARRIHLEHRMRIGIEREEFEPFYQPIYGIEGTMVALETLARWRHPDRGLVAPGDFIPVAERSGLLPEITDCLIRRAARDLDETDFPPHWDSAPRLNVNLSPTQVAQSDVADQLGELVDDHVPDGVEVALEITESQLLERFGSIRNLADAGFPIVVDDFGTGYSSLDRITEIPMDEIKLDMTFVHGALENPGDAAVVRTVNELGHQLGVPVVAEGIETLDQLKFVRDTGCHAAQGYLLARPAPFDDIVAQSQNDSTAVVPEAL
jgi:diguanylate cyclase (GGDEF)-like protein/PAS domain S-box-containing protein